MKNDYSSLSLLLSEARRFVMLPSNLEDGLLMAFNKCMIFSHEVNRRELDKRINGYIDVIDQMISAEEFIKNAGSNGAWSAKIKTLTQNQLAEFASALDDLADFFHEMHVKSNT